MAAHVARRVQNIVVFFERSHKLWFLLRQKLKEKKILILPEITRWESLLACLDSVLLQKVSYSPWYQLATS